MNQHTLLPILLALTCLQMACSSSSDSTASDPDPADLSVTPDFASVKDMAQEDMAQKDMARQDLAGQDMTAQGDMAAQDMKTAPGACPVAPPTPGVVNTRSGPVQGRVQGEGLEFLGIPFAAAPVGALRWRPPESPACWGPEPKATVAFGPRCPQMQNKNVVGDEDCLKLNVWTPSADTTEKKPVLVFVHGGGNVLGSASETLAGGKPTYDGRFIAQSQDVVVVTIQYRLGPLGYLALPELRAEDPEGHVGNYGLQDQIKALTWVQENAAAFGGDPGKVMVFGESAGAINTCMLIASPKAKGLFHAALMQSGGCAISTQEEGELASTRVMAYSSCAEPKERLKCLRNLPAQTLIKEIPGGLRFVNPGQEDGTSIAYGPVIDGWLLPKSPYQAIVAGEHNMVPTVVGSNAEEMASKAIFPLAIQTSQQYENVVRATLAARGKDAQLGRVLELYPVAAYDSPQDALIQVFTDATFTCTARTIARALAKHQGPTWRYVFRRRAKTPMGELAASHGIELLYVFNTLNSIRGYTPAPADAGLSDTMMGLWAGLIKSGRFGGFAPYAEPNEGSVVLDEPVRVEEKVRHEKCELWDEVLGVVR